MPAHVAAAVALVAGADPFGEPQPVDPDEIRDAACDATARSEVCSPDVADIPEAPDVPDVPDVSAGGGAIGQLLVILLVAALIAVLVWLLYQFVVGRTVRAEGDDDDDDLDATEDLDDELPRIIDEERPPDRWRRRAEEHRGRNEFRDAIRCEYRALVGDLARAGFVDEIPGRTSGEERAQIADIAQSGSPVPSRFDTAADLFDHAWFDTGTGDGSHDIGAADDERFVAASTAVLDELLARSLGRGDR